LQKVTDRNSPATEIPVGFIKKNLGIKKKKRILVNRFIISFRVKRKGGVSSEFSLQAAGGGGPLP